MAPSYLHQLWSFKGAKRLSHQRVWNLGSGLGDQKLRHHLYGRSFTVKTASNVLNWLWKKDVSGKFARWLLSLQEFQFNIQHVKGTNNSLADALSRAPVREAEDTDCQPICSVQQSTYTPRKLAQLQQQDTAIKDLFVGVANNLEDDKFLLHRGVLYPQSSDPGRPERLVVPFPLQVRLIESCHDGLVGSHLGVEKTLEKLKQRFWWPGVKAAVRRYVRSCPFCQLYKRRTAP